MKIAYLTLLLSFSWMSFPDLKFCIVNPSMLAMVWGQVKQNASMDWEKIKKVVNTANKGIQSCHFIFSLGPGPVPELEFTFLIVPMEI